MLPMTVTARTLFCVAVALPHAAAQTAARFDLSTIDKSVSPCEDFYQYSCGAWLARTPVPKGGVKFMEIQRMNERSIDRLQKMMDAAIQPDPDRDPLTRLYGDFYYACNDRDTIEKRGGAALAPWLARIAAVRTPDDLMAEAARLTVLDVKPLWNLSGTPNDSGVLAWTMAAPAAATPLTGAAAEYTATLFQLAGQTPAQADASAKAAAAALRALPSGRRRRDYEVWMNLVAARGKYPNLSLRRQFEALGVASGTLLLIRGPEYFRALDRALRKTPLEAWKALLAAVFLARTTDQHGQILARGFRDAQRTLDLAVGVQRGEVSQENFCWTAMEKSVGEAMGRKYVEKYLPPQTKQRIEEMTADMRAGLADLIANASWMSAATRRQALEKAAAMEVGVGYPPRWTDYSSLRIERDDALGNRLRATEFNAGQLLSQFGKRMERDRWWDWTPITDNLGYFGTFNAVELPAAMLDPPGFDPALPDAVNYSSLDGGVAHEISHGFDDGGRQFDGLGLERDWWTPEDARQYAERAQCFVAQYSAAPLPGGLHVDGRKTLNENIADSAGMAVAYAAFTRAMARRGRRMDDPAAGQDGFTPAQLFFLGWSINRCAQLSQEALAAEVGGDRHSPERLRVNLPVSNMMQFREAFACQTGQTMSPERVCAIW
jgi:predicted metalloendopeptidase